MNDGNKKDHPPTRSLTTRVLSVHKKDEIPHTKMCFKAPDPTKPDC
jgi:hypothetical protein